MPPHNCEKCKEKFLLSEDLEKHTRSYEQCRPYACPVPGCSYRAMARSHLQSHRKFHAATKSHECNQCNFRSKYKGSVKTHCATVHCAFPRPRPFKCKDCNFASHDVWQLKNHAKKHSQAPKLVYCDEPGCSWKSRWAASLIGHKKLHSRDKSNAKWFRCTMCDYQSLQRSGINAHIKTHSNERPFRCRVPGCYSDFKTNGDRKKHENTHDLRDEEQECDTLSRPKRFPCSFTGCDYIGKRRYHLKEHVNRRHEDSRTPEFVCNLCSKSFFSPVSLQSHVSHVHTQEKLYECDHPGCEFFAASAPAMRSHTRTHSLEKKRFHCNFNRCKFRTKTWQMLKRHQIKVHQVEAKNKYHKCNLCLMRFRFYCQLEVHIRSHTKERGFRCATCKFEAESQNMIKCHVCPRRAADNKSKESMTEMALKRTFCVVTLTRIKLC